MKQPAEVTPYGHPRKSQTISWDPATSGLGTRAKTTLFARRQNCATTSVPLKRPQASFSAYRIAVGHFFPLTS